ncbi:hypothetical protein DL93DRAFT_2179632 [Clavulina sp. PMI_390]|nr:hypothetical protein DL93DRAFT_2179632 [Clavulina sp. PMI_390]
MLSLVPLAAAVLALVPSAVEAQATAQAFVAPASCPTCTSDNYIGKSNTTLPAPSRVKGKSFGRIIQIWLENTDYTVAGSSPTFQKLATQGITLSSYLSLTHPSEPNYIGSFSGDFWGLAGDNYYHVPENITTVVDLLEEKDISWATYQENMPRTAWAGDFSQSNYVTGANTSYTYYLRKHNPPIIHDVIANDTRRAARVRNFNDFAADIKANAIPQWVFITPNIVNDAHDTTIDYTSSWLEYFLVPLLNDTRFSSGSGTDGTLIVLTFDENHNFNIKNNVFTLLLGSAVPKNLHGTVDSTIYSHYSTISTVEGNWGLNNLGRGDVNATLGNVFDFVAKKIGFKNNQIANSSQPLNNAYGIFNGPFNPSQWIPFTAPTQNVSRFGGHTLVKKGLDFSITKENQTPLNLTYEDSFRD